MNTLSQPIIESALQASNLVLQLKDSFEPFSLLQQSSLIGTQHLAVGASVYGPINIGGLGFNLGRMIIRVILAFSRNIAFSGLFSIPVTFSLMYNIYAYLPFSQTAYSQLLNFDA